MKRIVGAAVIVAAVAVLLFTQFVSAQGRGRAVVTEAQLIDGFGAMIGVSVRDLTQAEASGAAAQGGVMIDAVDEGTPAARAGFKAGDIVVEFDGERIRSARQFSRLVRETPPGRAVTAAVIRGGSRETVSVTPESRTAANIIPRDLGERLERSLRALPRNFDFDFDFDFDRSRGGVTILSRGRLGATLTTVSPQLAEYFGVKEGLLVTTVEPDSAAATAGLRAGDVLTAIGGTTVQAPGDVTRALRALQPGATAELRVMRDRKEMTLTVTVPDRPTPRAPGIRTRGVTA